MPDYKEMYLIMARAAEKAERILIEAQRRCEELYLAAEKDEEDEDKYTPPDRSGQAVFVTRSL